MKLGTKKKHTSYWWHFNISPIHFFVKNNWNHIKFFILENQYICTVPWNDPKCFGSFFDCICIESIRGTWPKNSKWHWLSYICQWNCWELPKRLQCIWNDSWKPFCASLPRKHFYVVLVIGFIKPNTYFKVITGIYKC